MAVPLHLAGTVRGVQLWIAWVMMLTSIGLEDMLLKISNERG
jgi:hypothetical protein